MRKRREKDITLILANLTAAEDARFHKAHIGYSGSTGPNAKPESYGGLAPYIATAISELRPSLRALRWRNFVVAATPNQWIVKKFRPGKRG